MSPQACRLVVTPPIQLRHVDMVLEEAEGTYLSFPIIVLPATGTCGYQILPPGTYEVSHKSPLTQAFGLLLA